MAVDLKLKDVAELLNISESTVRRLLADGKIPGYRLNRQYRFNRSEIEDWVMRQKLDYGIEEEKAATDDSSKSGAMQFSLYRALYRGGVLSDLKAKSKQELIGMTMKDMAKRFELDADVLTDLFLDREKLMSTGLGHGIAVPHTRDFLLDTHYDVILVVYPEQPIEFGALDNEPVHTLFFLFAAEDKAHLHLLAKIAHLCHNEKARAFLSTKPSKERLLEYVKHWESTFKH
jgi:PTS system nitrogen regulatory IIA component